jgi:N-acetyl-gamma-glutamyl-phosphate reductase
LVAQGLLPADWPVTVHAVSGYSGGGKAMIAEFEDADGETFSRDAVRIYATGLRHKHVAEMQRHAGLGRPPLFSPAVGRYHQGMIVEVPLPLAALPTSPSLDQVRDILEAAYAGELFVSVADKAETEATPSLQPEALNGTNQLKLYAFGDPVAGQARLVALLDNLGKGASGAAVQSLNLMAGLEEGGGL